MKRLVPFIKAGERRGTPEEKFSHKIDSRYISVSLTTVASGLNFTKVNETIIIINWPQGITN